MKEKKSTTESFDQWEAWAQKTYRTGGTQPPKSHGGLIAFLFAVIIFLCGISTALGLMNIRLFQQLNSMATEESCPVVFSKATLSSQGLPDSPLGFYGQEVSTFWQNYRDLPKGIYVTKVIVGSDACTQGVLPGDVLITVDGHPISGTDTLEAVLSDYSPGDSVSVTFHRNGEERMFSLILE